MLATRTQNRKMLSEDAISKLEKHYKLTISKLVSCSSSLLKITNQERIVLIAGELDKLTDLTKRKVQELQEFSELQEMLINLSINMAIDKTNPQLTKLGNILRELDEVSRQVKFLLHANHKANEDLIAMYKENRSKSDSISSGYNGVGKFNNSAYQTSKYRQAQMSNSYKRG